MFQNISEYQLIILSYNLENDSAICIKIINAKNFSNFSSLSKINEKKIGIQKIKSITLLN